MATSDAVFRGARSFRSGQAAETGVARHYAGRGMTIAAQRWRGGGGEIDLIARDGDVVVFIEVKQARSHAEAAERLGAAQMRRIVQAATVYCDGEPKGQFTEVRFDLALVDGQGRIDIIENALAA
jgi:putative endonuclease